MFHNNGQNSLSSLITIRQKTANINDLSILSLVGWIQKGSQVGWVFLGSNMYAYSEELSDCMQEFCWVQCIIVKGLNPGVISKVG